METSNETTANAHGLTGRDQIMTDLKTLARDAENLLKATAEDASERAKEARARLQSALDGAKSTFQIIEDQGIETAKATAKKADTVIRDHPYESIGVAFGIGLLVGVILRRK